MQCKFYEDQWNVARGQIKEIYDGIGKLTLAKGGGGLKENDIFSVSNFEMDKSDFRKISHHSSPVALVEDGVDFNDSEDMVTSEQSCINNGTENLAHSSGGKNIFKILNFVFNNSL
jgi:hypothetical protein